jgi:hypothetical protein
VGELSGRRNPYGPVTDEQAFGIGVAFHFIEVDELVAHASSSTAG